MKRRNVLKTLTATSALSLIGSETFAQKKKKAAKFRFSLNTSTISGQKLGIEKYIDIAARAGYDCIEPWIGDLKAYVSNGGSLKTLKKLLDDSKLSAEGEITACLTGCVAIARFLVTNSDANVL
mgnify:CR=1 FL=1